MPYRTALNSTAFLWKARYARLIANTGAETRLVFISDMIEECGTTPLGGRISLAKPDITEEITRATKYRASTDLAGVQIDAIIPVVQQTVLVRADRRSPIADRRRFWTAVFERCGARRIRIGPPSVFAWLPN